MAAGIGNFQKYRTDRTQQQTQRKMKRNTRRITSSIQCTPWKRKSFGTTLNPMILGMFILANLRRINTIPR